MDPTAVPVLTGLVTGVLSGAAGDAGRRAWSSLSELIHRTFDRDDPATRSLAQVQLIAGDPQMVEAMAGEFSQRLTDAAQRDPVFAAMLDAWMTDADRIVHVEQGTVTNRIDGEVQGPVVQGRDFSGQVNLSSPEPDQST